MNMHEHGWNPDAATHGEVTGGVFINWKMDDPSVTNALGVGASEETQANHDPQVDLFYLMALADYQRLHPQDRTFNTDIDRMTATVINDFRSYNLPKGWIYFYLLRSGQLLHNSDLMNEAHTTAEHYYSNWYDSSPGLVYDKKHKPANYSPNLSLQAGAALIDAGLRWNEPAWVDAGKRTIDHVLTFALDPTYHLFYNSMSVNSDGQDQVMNYQAKPSTQGEAALALMYAYNLAHNQHYLDVTDQVLHSLFNTSGLWDKQRGGFFFALDMSKHKLLTGYKETRSQTLVLMALHSYNQAKQQELAGQEQQVIRVLTDQFYQATYHGYFYRVTPDFQVYVDKPGQGIGVEDYFTSEAMGGALDALQRTKMSS